MPNPRSAHALWGLLLPLGIARLAGCCLSEPATGGRHVESPHGGGGDAVDGGRVSTGNPASTADAGHRNLKLGNETFYELVAALCPRRPFSYQVPDRACSKDEECGDGFCDRGRCSAIYTCGQDLGFPCEEDGQCPYLFCIDGRCRSCVSDEKCQERLERPDVVCGSPARRAPGRECMLANGALPVDMKAVCDRVKDLPACKGP